MSGNSPAANRHGHAARGAVVLATILASAALVWQSTLVWPGTVAAMGGVWASAQADATETPPPDPGPTVEPTLGPEATAAPEPTPTPELTPEPTPEASPQPTPVPPQGGPLVVSHHTFARVLQPETAPEYLTPDTPLLDEPRFQILRLRFELANQTAGEVSLTPLLQFGAAGDGTFEAVPEGVTMEQPFFAATEWIAAPGGGTMLGPTLVIEPTGSSRPGSARSMGVNPMPPLTVAGGGSVTIEFSVSATAAAAYEAAYFFMLSDAGTPLAASSLPELRMEAQPPLELTPGQRNGAPPDSGATPTGPLLGPNQSSSSVHTASYELTGEFCATCHRAHRASGSSLVNAPTQLALCSTCHNGTDLPSIAAEYALVPPNNEAARAYYQHDPNLEQGVVGTANACAECHNPHDISSDPATQTVTGWAPSGLTYGAADGSGQRISLEYQLCFKCHASPATLPSNVGQPYSRYALDKAVEFAPSAGSYHPIEQAGTNATSAMLNSLMAGSPYKLWASNFTPDSTIRCVNCHADARLAQAAYAANAYLDPDSVLPVHASPQRGLLIAPYQDRVLNNSGPLETYQAADFALCFTCHSEAPFVDDSGDERTDTNFRYHGVHVSGSALVNHGNDGTDIDRPGDGGGPAICAECHFRIHSTASATDVYGQPAGSRLVVFAPNVSGGLTPTVWSAKTDTTPGTCSLKCHGQPHSVTY